MKLVNKLYGVKNIIVGRILKMPENSDIFMRTIIIKNVSEDYAMTLYSKNKDELRLDNEK